MKVQISADAPALAYGLGLFETMRVARGRVVQAEEHFERMRASAEALSFPLPKASSFRQLVNAAARNAVLPEEAAVRCLYVATDSAKWRLVATSSSIPEGTLRRRRYGRAITLAGTRSLPQHKLTSYASSFLGLREAQAKGADEGLFLDRRDRVLEGTATNVFAIAGNILITAPVRDGLLPGVVRGWVIAHAPDIGLRVVERAPTIGELRAGSFFTSSLTMLAAIRSVDGIACRPPGDLFEELKEMYRRV